MNPLVAAKDYLKGRITFFQGQKTEHTFCYDSPFSMPISLSDFVSLKITALYEKILTDCYSRGTNYAKDTEKVLWSSCVNSYGKSISGDGLISLLAKAMATKQDLYLTYRDGVISQADYKEIQEVKDAFEKKEKDKLPKDLFWFSFINYKKTDILKLLYALEFLTLKSANTAANISQAVQIKISDLRALVSNDERISAIEQAGKIAEGLKDGKAIVIDAKDAIDTTQIDMSAIQTTISFLDGLKAEVLNMPLLYINGEQAAGLSTTGESDSLAVERGLRSYFNSIFKPCIDEIFKSDIRFKKDNWRMLASIANLLPIIESSGLIADEKKTELLAEMFE